MPTVTIKFQGLKEALANLGKVESDLIPVAAKAAALETIAVAKPYPNASRAKQPFRSLKSQRFFFAALRDGKITVPYRRSFDLQDAWEWQPEADGADVINPNPHADMTINKATRFKYHKSTWPDEEKIAALAAPRARDMAEMSIIRLIAQADF